MKKNSFTVLLIGLALSISVPTSAETFRGLEVKKIPFTVSGGQTIELAMTDQGPIPARSNDIVVETAGPIFGPSKSESGNLDLVWAFSIKVPEDLKYDSVAIDEVSGKTAFPVLAVTNVASKPYRTPDGQTIKLVMLRSSAVSVGPESTSWVYEQEPSLFVYRIVLKKDTGNTITLYQPTLFRNPEKAQIRKMASKTGLVRSGN